MNQKFFPLLNYYPFTNIIDFMRLRGFAKTLIYVVVGGAAFWLPAIIVHAVRAYEFTNTDVGIVTVLLPLALIFCYGILNRFMGKQLSGHSVAFFMLLGIWILGPLFMTINASFSGGGFSRESPLVFIAIATVLFPIATFIMSTYDGSLGAVILATVIMLVIGIYRTSKTRPRA
ncbi:MAG: hypothetical protein ACR2GW_09310 [Pyrinomonadaceae bacterium]